ncbi:MAG: hypothetical protein WCI38_10430 [Chthoniobacterales bacterium]
MADAEKTLRIKSRPARPKLEPERKLRINSFTAYELPPQPKAHTFPGGRVPLSHKRRRKTEARLEQIKFLVLCLLFAAFVLFVWKNLT